MNISEIIALVLIVIGAVVNFLVPSIIKKKAVQPDIVPNSVYVLKSIGLVLVIIGCIIFFWLGGKFSG